MLWIAYNILFPIGFILMLPHFLLRMKRRGGYARDFMQRFGRYAPVPRAALGEGGRVWVHAVSVGELFVATKFMDELRARCPGIRFVFSTTTSTGYALACKKIAPPDVVIYFPVDFPPIIHRVLNLIRPKALVLVESELWPNVIRLAAARGIPVMLINGRMSERSYGGYRRLRPFTRALLEKVDCLCVQSEPDRDRFQRLGAEEGRLFVMGSAKYDQPPPDAGASQAARSALELAGIGANRLILLGGSTWPGEETALLNIYMDLRVAHPELFLVLVPRHFERGHEVQTEIEKRGLSVLRRSRMPPTEKMPDVLLVDTTGELIGFYMCADIVFVGKSLSQHGGQNIIEPALCGKPVLVGPNMENFKTIAGDFLGAGAMIQVQDAPALKQAVSELVGDPVRRAELGRRAGQLVHEKAGAVKATADRFEKRVGA